MTLRNFFLASVGVFGVCLIGAGCSKPVPPAEPPITQGPEATSTLQTTLKTLPFIPGDSFEIWPPGVSSSSTGELPVRVLIDRFAPRNHAGLSWRLGSATGSLSQIDLAQTHILILPAFWTKGSRDLVNAVSAIWLTDDAYQAVNLTQQLILDTGLQEASAKASIKKMVPGSATMWDRIVEQIAVAQQKTDVNFVLGVERIAWPIQNNGRAETVPAMRIRNWFGEMIVLDDRDNPMILQFTFDPKTDTKTVDKSSKAFLALKKALSYRIDTVFTHLALQPKGE